MRRQIPFVLLISAFLLMMASTANAVIRHVPGQYSTIQAAIDVAATGDTVIVADGTYTGDGNKNINFKGKAITVRSTDPFDPAVVDATVIDCQNSGRGFNFVSGETRDSVLMGLTIKNGRPGGIYCSGSSPTIKYCNIRNNSVNNYGGGIYCTSASPLITCCFISGNSAHIGGGIYSSGGTPIISNSMIIGNSVGHNGGGLFCSSSATVRHCTITKNSTGYKGAGIYSSSGTEVSNCIIWGNNGPEVYGSGSNIIYSNVEGGYPGIGNINVDSLFVDPGSDDYHLSANSFCINSGDPTYIPDPFKTDIDGEPRVINGRTDIGADEFNYEGPILASYPTEFSFSAYTLGPNPAPQTLTIRNNGPGTLNWVIVEDCPWLEVNPTYGESTGEADEVVLSVDVSGLAPGQYNCELILTANGAFNSPQTNSVSLDVFEPVIEINPEQIEFSSPEGQRHPDDHLLNIFNSGTGTLDWWISADCNWLELNPSSGESTEEIDQVTLTATITNLDPGIYSCALMVDSNYASNGPQIVPVTLDVSEPYINYTPASFDLFMVEGDPPPANQILTISNGGGGTLIWEIDANCSWIQATPTEGETTDETNEVVLSLDTDELEPGSYSCIVTISATNATNDPQSITVSLYVHSDSIETLYVPSQFSTIQAAVDKALDGDTVVVADGTYAGIGNHDLDFKGKAITLQSIDPNDPNIVASTIIDCNGTAQEPHRGFYFHSGEDANSILKGFTIKNGYAYNGGGIYCNSSSPTIANCRFINCSAENWGGGLYCYKSSPLISNCTFTGNSAFEGGAITTYSGWNYLCSPHIENCHIFGNIACGSGGGINSDCLSTPIISNCLITGNFAGTYGGGGISIFQSNPSITNCKITGNSTSNSGGGILQWYYFENGSTINNCTIADNSADRDGGGICCEDSNSIITNCTISGNSAGRIGGGINCSISIATITNSTVTGNTASGRGGSGGGFSLFDGIYFIHNCTINGNYAADNGGGIYYGMSEPIVTNSILRQNEPEAICSSRDSLVVTFCNIQGGWDGIGNIDADPYFVDPGFWEGELWTDGDYHLLEVSPCIDSGDNTSVPADTADLDGDGNTTEPIPWDLDGNPRIVDGNSDGNSVVDMGAYEFVPMIEVPMKFTPQTLNLNSKGRWVKAHFVLPEDFDVNDVDANTPALIEPLGIQSEYMNVFINEDGFVEVETAFSRAEFCAVATGNEPVEITVTGLLTTGQQFYGTDTIRITNNNLEYLAVLSSNWLRTDCGQPDWCSGLDLDQNSIVNFIDFALLDGCCIEVIAE